MSKSSMYISIAEGQVMQHLVNEVLEGLCCIP